MKQSRLDALADGIFAIVMTILVFEVKVPDLGNIVTSLDLLNAIRHIFPSFLSYLLSFSVLFTFWRGHHFITSVYAKNTDIKLTNINAIFFFFVGLVPFTSGVLGRYSTLQLAVFIFATNIVAISIALYEMRIYARDSKTIENEQTDDREERHAFMRILFPAYSAVLAIVISFWSTHLALFILTFGIMYNLLTKSTKYTFKLLGKE